MGPYIFVIKSQLGKGVFSIYGLQDISDLGPVWYVCLKTKNCCLKTFIEIRVGEKVC